MLVITNLISELKQSFRIMETWNFHPFMYPYYLAFSKISNKFTVHPNKKFYRKHWLFHCTFLLSFFVFGLIKIRFDSKTLYAKCVTGFISFCAGLETVTICFHKIFCVLYAALPN